MSEEAIRFQGYRIVPAGLGDLGDIHRLERAVFSRDAYEAVTISGMLLWPFNVNLKSVVGDGKLVGHVAGQARPFSKVGWIITLAVAPAFQRRGIGWELLAACEARMDRRVVRLTVRSSNVAALALYEKAGYTRVRVWHRYYHDGEDGFVMGKRRA